MQIKIISKKHILFSIPLILAGTLLASGFALGESCPSITTVKGTIVTFVGELTDTGGDEVNYVWFEYGQSTDYGYKTAEKTLTQSGIYCITVSGLSDETTYHYRAAARNSAGTSYGEDKTFTTTAEPSVEIMANGESNSLTIPYNSDVTLTWIASNVNSCYASGGWSGAKGVSGSQRIYDLTSSETFTINCSGPRGSAFDSVRVYVEDEDEDEDVPLTLDDLECETISFDQIDLFWDYVDEVEGYRVYRCQGRSCNPTTLVKTEDDTYWSDTDLSPETTYRYRVRAYNDEGNSSYSRTVTCTTESSASEEAEISLRKTTRNISQGTSFSDITYAGPGDEILVGISVEAKDKPLHNLVVKDVLPSGLIYRGDLKVNNISNYRDILSGLDIGDLESGESKTITFRADVAGPESFSYGQTTLTNTVLVSSDEASHSDTAKVIISKAAVAGAATNGGVPPTAVSTGLTNNFFIDSFFLPLVLSLFIVWIFKSHIVNFEKRFDKRKKEYKSFKSAKELQLKVAQIKAKEFFQK